MATNILYKYTMRIELSRSSSDRNINLPMNRSNFKINKGYDTVIEFVIRDTDRKPIKLIDKKVELMVLDVKTNILAITKKAKIIDEGKGICSVTFNNQDMINLESKSYAYSVKLISGNGLSEILFIDQNQNSRGFFDLTQDSLPSHIPTIVVNTDLPVVTATSAGVNVISTSGGTTPTSFSFDLVPRFKTSSYSGESLSHNNLHTIAIYLNNFTGRLYIQGSLTESVSEVDDDWFDINPDGYSNWINFDSASGIESYNFICKIIWIRFFIQPRPVINKGGITKILLKN